VDVEVWAQLQEHSPAELASADLLFVGGGNTFRLLDQVRRHRFVTAVRDYVAAGGAYYGGSAGAVLAGTDVTIARGLDDNEVGLTDLSALGLVPEFTVLPHFTRDQEAFARAWCGEHRRVVLGVPERAGLVAESGTVQVLGTEAVWQFTEAGVSEHAPGERWALTSPRTPGLNDRGER
jgi:dipeptidase E